MTATVDTQTAATGTFARLRTAFVAMMTAAARRRAARELRRLDDRMLRDLGIDRGDIDAVVYGLDSRRAQKSAPVAAAPASSANDNADAVQTPRAA
ncbi:DUF1127 domain-containing protein [Futiania mangrovi]|uniref:DUF1127 domain-containing protein n=1 Tax=Futiania mangrovi TaxID=2959716 RepID=A0A9J6PAC7_9PROT|nr:DUF1127 domain-containing protein [Futiania mangrovii]MCP1334966.1 DUF1127 domain-containing protein [Futiania mangrovii]